MSHLPAERLAALADAAALEPTTPRDAAPAVGGPFAPITAEEAEHLAACAECARERAAHRALLALAADERARLAPPLTSWGAIAAQLRDEGLLGGVDDGTAAASPESRVPALAFTGSVATAAAGGRRRRGTALVASHWGLRAAAAVLLAAGGAVAGRASVVSGGGSAASPLLGVAAAARSAARDSVAAVASSGAGRGIASLVADTMNAFHSTTDALVALARAEHDYQVAATYLLAHDSSAGGGSSLGAGSNGGDNPGVYRARLAALDNVVAASREALYDAPHDPVINRYYIATVRDREATLQQLNTALPAGARLTRF